MSTSGNYTEDEKNKVLELYEQLGNEGLDTIAKQLGKTVNSVRAKLVKEGAYIAPEKPSTRKLGPSKKDILNNMEKLGVPSKVLDGLMPSNKESLSLLYDFIKGMNNPK